MFRKSRASSSPTSPTSPSSGAEANNEISDSYEVVQTPSGSEANSRPSSDAPAAAAAARRARSASRRRPSHPIPPTPGVTPPPHVRQASSRDDWYPSWLPRRPPPPAPASTVPSERGHGSSPIPRVASNVGTSRGASQGSRPQAPGAHRLTPSYDTGYTGYTDESGEYVDIGEYELDPALAESEGTEERVGIGRRQTPRSVRIISEATQAAGSYSRRHAPSRHSRRASGGASQMAVRSRKEGRAGHVHGSGPKPWWRGTMSTPLTPTVVAPSPFPGGLGGPSPSADAPFTAPQRASVPPHMRAYLPTPGMTAASQFPSTPLASLRPRFRAPGLDLGFLAPPSAWKRLQFILWPVWVYGLVVLQSYLDLNAIYCLVQPALHPTPATPPSATSDNSNPSSSRNWALGASAYGVCWLIWIVGVVILYEVVYSWWRRWRCKRPLMIPLYLSAPAFNLVCMTSYANFCFFQYIRASARPRLPLPRIFRACGSSSSGSTIPSRAVTPSVMSAAEPRDSQQQEREPASPMTAAAAAAEVKENVPIISPSPIRNPSIEPMSSLASWGDWFAETCFFYGQNLPTVALLLPRAALCIAILLAFSSAPPEDRALAALGLMKRDQTFFRADGSLSGYARVVLLANVAWAGWRVLILLISWVGLWWMSGQLCAGVCGPRFRWEEPEERVGYDERGGRVSMMMAVDEEQFEDAHGVMAMWTWRECTRIRIYDAYDLCLFLPPLSKRAAEKARDVSGGEKSSVQRVGGGMDEDEENAVLDRVLAAAGLPTVPTPARRGMLHEELFSTPPEMRRELSEEGGIREITVSSPKPGTKESSSRSSGERPPSNMKPYPFTTYPARQGSQDAGLPSQERIPFPPSPRTSKHSDREGTEREGTGEEEEEAEGVEEEEEEDDYDNEEGYDEFGLSIEEPSSGRNSASMSSLGQQIPSRFPFQFRHISRRSRGGRSSAGTHQSRSTSDKTSSASYGASQPSQPSRTASSSDRRVSQHSDSPWSQGQSQSGAEASTAQSPVSPRDVGTTESSSYGSPISGRLGGSLSGGGGALREQSPIPMPPRAAHKNRRQRASLPTVPVSAIPAAFAGVRDRSRTLSGSTPTSPALNLSPHPQYENSSGEEEEEEEEQERAGAGGAAEFGMLTDPEADGSQEEAEREDSVGLLSGGPSPRSSVGGLRSRSNISLSNINLGIPHSRRSRHSSASSMSNSHSHSSRNSRSISLSGSGSGSGSGSQGASARSRSISIQARSRAQSFVQGFAAANRSNISFEMGGIRSRASSLARLSEVPSVHRQSGESGRTGSFSASTSSNVVSPTQHSTNPEDYTFGQPIRLRVDSGSEGERRGSRIVAGPGLGTGMGMNGQSPQRGQSPISTSKRPSRQGTSAPAPAAAQADPARTLRESQSHTPSLAPSSHSQQTTQTVLPSSFPSARAPGPTSTALSTLPVPISPTSPRTLQHSGQSFISSARESFITQPTMQEGGSSSDNATAHAPGSSYGTISYEPRHVQGREASEFRPA